MSGIKAARRLQLFKESVAGTPGVATALWRGTGVLDDKREVVFVEEDVGFVVPLDRTYIPKLLAGLGMDATPATFEQLPYLLSAGIQNIVTGVADGAGSGKIYAYNLPTTAARTIKTYTIEGGDDQQKEEAEYAFIESLKISGKMGEAVMMSGAWAARQITPGIETAGTGIAFVASTKKITDTGAGLAQFVTGTTIKVTGTANNNGVYTVATGGVAGEIVVTETLVDEAAGATVTVEDWFSGGPAGITVPTVEEILASKSKLYIDVVGGSFGGTLKSNTLLNYEFDLKSGFAARFNADGNLYFSRHTFTREGFEGSLKLTFEHDGTAEAERLAWRAETSKKIRLLIQGAALGTAGTTYTYKSLIADLVGKWEKIEKLSEDNGNDTVSGTFKVAYNSTAATTGVITVVNELASLT